MKPVIAALAAGNRVMVKPPEQAPATSQVMAEWMQASLPADRVQVLLGGPEEAAHLTTLPFDHIFFTGGTVTGRKVIRAAAEHLTPLTLEWGGKSPAIIDGTMNPDLVAGREGWAKALNAGQVCIAPDYLLIKDTAVDDMVAALARRWDGWFGEDKSASIPMAGWSMRDSSTAWWRRWRMPCPKAPPSCTVADMIAGRGSWNPPS